MYHMIYIDISSIYCIMMYHDVSGAGLESVWFGKGDQNPWQMFLPTWRGEEFLESRVGWYFGKGLLRVCCFISADKVCASWTMHVTP